MTEKKLTTLIRTCVIAVLVSVLTWVVLDTRDARARSARADQLLAEMEQIVAESRAALTAPEPGKQSASRDWPPPEYCNSGRIAVFAAGDTAYIRFIDPPAQVTRVYRDDTPIADPRLRAALKERLRAASARAAAATDSQTGVIHMTHIGDHCWRCLKDLRGRPTVWGTVRKDPGEGTVPSLDNVVLPFCSASCCSAERAKREAAFRQKEATR